MIDINNITFEYLHGRPVLKDFTLSFPQGGVYGLLGKNGTGKSTLLYLISGLLRPSKGEVRVDGLLAQNRQPEMLKEVFLVPEEYDLPAVRLQQYARVLKPFYPRFSDELLRSCIEGFDLDMDMHLGALSMGQKKKVYMCVAMATGTRVLLMDEPTNGLDIPSKTQFRKVVANNMTDDRILVISTHQVHDVESLLDHILILSESRMLLNASTAEICEKYAFEYRSPQEMDDDVVYSEPAMQGSAVIATRKEGMDETQLNLELLFNAVVEGKVSI